MHSQHTSSFYESFQSDVLLNSLHLSLLYCLLCPRQLCRKRSLSLAVEGQGHPWPPQGLCCAHVWKEPTLLIKCAGVSNGRGQHLPCSQLPWGFPGLKVLRFPLEMLNRGHPSPEAVGWDHHWECDQATKVSLSSVQAQEFRISWEGWGGGEGGVSYPVLPTT